MLSGREFDTVKSGLLRLVAGMSTPADMETVQRFFRDGQITVATGERAVAGGGDATDAVIITGDGNVVHIFKGTDAEALHQTVQQIFASLTPPALLPFTAFAQRAELASLASYRGDLIGRETLLEEITAYLSGTDRVMILHGTGGIGKTHLLLTLPRLLPNGTNLWFARTEAESIEQTLATLDTNGSHMIVVDDARRFAPLPHLREVLVNPSFAHRVTLLLATRSVFTDIIRAQFTSLPDNHIPALEVGPLTAANMNRILQNSPHQVMDEAVRYTLIQIAEGNALIAGIAARLVHRGASLAGLTRDQVLTRYLDRILYDLAEADRASYAHYLGYLEVLAALDTVDPSNEALCTQVRQSLNISPREETTILARLVGAGLVERSWMTVKIASEVLADHILLSHFFDSKQSRGSYEKQIIEPFFALKPKDILTMLAKAEYKGESAEAGLMLGQKLDELSRLVTTEGNFVRFVVLNWLDEVAYLRPDDILMIVASIVDGSEPPIESVRDPWWGTMEIQHEMVLDKAANLLSKTVYSQGLADTISYLYRLATYEPATSSYARVRAKANNTLKSIATLTPGKPYTVQKILMQHIAQWIQKDFAGKVDLCVALLAQLLKMDWEQTKTDPMNPATVIWEQGFLGIDETLRTIREQALEGLYTLYRQSTQLTERLKVVQALEAAVAFIGPDVEVPLSIKSWSQPGCVKTAHFFSTEAIPQAELPVLDAVSHWLWRARNLGNYQAEELLRVQQHLQEHRLYRLFRLLIGRFRWDDDDNHSSWQEKEQRRKQEVEDYVQALSSATILQAIQDLAEIAEQVRGANNGDTYWFWILLELLGERHPELACQLIEKAVIEDLLLRHDLGFVLAGMRWSDLERAKAFIAMWTKGDDEVLICAALQSYTSAEWKELQEDEWRLLFELVERDLSAIDYVMLQLIPQIAPNQPDLAVQAIKQIIARGNEHILCRIADILTWPHPTQTGWAIEVPNLQDYLEILRYLERLPKIDHAIEQCLERLGQTDPMKVIEFLERRIANIPERRQADKDYRAIPFQLVSGLESIRSSPAYREVLRRVRDWMLREEAWFRWETTHTLKALAGSLDDALCDVLMEWVCSSDVHKQ